MATNDCIVHSRKNISDFHAAVNQLVRENNFSKNIYQQLPKRCCSCNGKTDSKVIDFNILIKICEEIMSEEVKKPKFSYELILTFESETNDRERRRRIGRFIGKEGINLNVLQDKYNILICIKQNSPLMRVRRRNFEKQETENLNELQVVVRRKDNLMTDTIPIDKIKKEINEQWEEASEMRFIQKQYTFDQNQFQFVTLSFQGEHDIMGRFIGQKGKNLCHLEDQYNIRLHIISDRSPDLKYLQKLIGIQEDNPNIFYLFITKKDQSITNEIPIEQIKEQIIQKWTEANIKPIDDELYHILTFSYESIRTVQEEQKKVGRFIGKNGRHLHHLQDKYNVNIQIINNSSRKTLRKKLAKIQDKDEINKLYLLIANKDKSSTNTIPIDKIQQELIERWTNRERKQMLLERLFPLILEIQPRFAATITHMLLELDNTELVHIIESPELLKIKVDEAIAVIQADMILK